MSVVCQLLETSKSLLNAFCRHAFYAPLLMLLLSASVFVPLQLLVLENVRFYKEETKNDAEFAKKVRVLGLGTALPMLVTWTRFVIGEGDAHMRLLGQMQRTVLRHQCLSSISHDCQSSMTVHAFSASFCNPNSVLDHT